MKIIHENNHLGNIALLAWICWQWLFQISVDNLGKGALLLSLFWRKIGLKGEYIFHKLCLTNLYYYYH